MTTSRDPGWRPPQGAYDRLLLALQQQLAEAQRDGDAGVREWVSLAMLDAIGIAEERGMMRGGEAGGGKRS